MCVDGEGEATDQLWWLFTNEEIGALTIGSGGLVLLLFTDNKLSKQRRLFEKRQIKEKKSTTTGKICTVHTVTALKRI